MTKTVALHEAALAHIGDRLKSLSLDIKVIPMNDNGEFIVDGKVAPAKDLELDYMWMSYHHSGMKSRGIVCDAALACKSLDVLQTFNAGLDFEPYKQVSDNGTRICNSSAQAVAISEYVMAQVMGLIHPIDLQRSQQADKIWERTPFRELSRMQWLIVGFGPIAQQIAQRTKAFGATNTVIRRTPALGDHVDRVGTMQDLQSFLPDADVIVLACPLNNDTRGFVDKNFFSSVKQDSVLVNIARGGLIEDQALIDALDNGKLATAILDVFHEEPLPTDNPLWSHPKVRLTPHTSFNGNGVRERWDQLFLDNIVRYVNGDSLLHEVAPADI